MMTTKELGEKFVRLGELLQDENSTIRDIATAALDCWLKLEFRLRSEDQCDGDSE